jgi:methionyl-tRNA formyltransferase
LEKKNYYKKNKEKNKDRQVVKILFFGSNFVSKIYLENLHKNNYKIFVVTTPDAPSFKRQHKFLHPVKIYAKKNNIDFIQIKNFDQDIINIIKKIDFDIGIVVSYGKLIPKSVFNLPKNGTFNIHFSLLPKYRGASPVQYALINGDIETGVTSLYVDDGLDTGDILLQEKLKIYKNDNAEILFNKLIPLGIKIMNKTINLFQKKNVNIKSQTGKISFAPILKKNTGLINWSRNANDIYNQFRGLYIWPGIYSIISYGKLVGKRIKFINIEIFENKSLNRDFGRVFSIEKNKGFTVLCSRGKILVLEVQLEGKLIMSAWLFIQSKLLLVGDVFRSK